MKNKFNKEKLNKLYWENNFCLREIAYIYNVDKGTIRYWMKKFEISRRKPCIAWLGKSRSDETKKKIGEAHKGKKLSAEHKKKIGDAQRGSKSYFWGKNHSKESIKKISENSYYKGKTKEESFNWKGGKFTDKQGRIFIYKPEHPNSHKDGYILEHRLIMEKYLGRYLNLKEVIHHINNKSNDNRIENLMLFSSCGEHIKYHYKIIDPFLGDEDAGADRD